MIVRILGENQYRVDDVHKETITNLDEDLLVAIDTDNHDRFQSLLSQILTLIRQHEEVPADELVSSDLIVPAPDMTLEEARKYLEENPC
jgi:CBS-domain-containing membrane protein